MNGLYNTAVILLFVLMRLANAAQTDAAASPPLDAPAIRYARESGSRNRIPELRQCLHASDEAVRIAAMVTLSQWGDDESRPAFLTAAKSDIARIRLAGKDAIKRLDALERFLPYKDQSIPKLSKMLTFDRANVRHEAAEALLRFGPKAKDCIKELSSALSKLDGAPSIEQIVPYLELLKIMGSDAGECGGILCELLEERSKIYTDRDKHEVYKLRGYLLMTLADIHQARLGYMYIADMLANSNQVMDFNFSAAAYAAGSLGPDAKELVPLLARALDREFNDAVAAPGAHGDKRNSFVLSSGRIEALRALDSIGPSARQVLPQLEDLMQYAPKLGDKVPPWKVETKKALMSITELGARR